MKKLFFTAILFSALAFSAKAQVPTNGLVGCYSFDGNANDYSGNSNNGTPNAVTNAVGHLGNANSAYYFNGTSSYVDIPNFGTMVPQNELSICFWAKIDANASNNSNTAFMLSPDDESDRLVGCVYYEGNDIWDYGNMSGGSGRSIVSAGTFSSSWNYFVFEVSESSNIKKVYENGTAIINTTFTDSLVNRAKTLRIGGRIDQTSGSIRLHGDMDELRIYDRALTANEVTALYNSTQSCAQPTGIKKIKVTENDVNIYPNPFLNQLSILNNGSNVLNATLYNAMGQKVKQFNLKQKVNKIDVHTYPQALI